MSAKLPHPLMDENTDLQKQIGCMSGIFLLFDRRYFLSSGRITSHNHKRLPQGTSNVKATEKHLEKGVKEKRRVSSESSTTSFSSSSCSSTFSSVDRSKTAQLEQSSIEHSIFPRNQSQIPPTKHPDPSPHSRQQSSDLRDVVKDSVCKETHELSVKTTTKAKGVSRVVKNVDSPRPPKDAPRFSYDERVSRDKWKSATKLKELPRLSLDSRERSFRKFVNGTAPNNILDGSKHENDMSSQSMDLHQETRSNKKPSSVVAKLMGLEAFPDSNDEIREVKCRSDGDLGTRSTSSRKADECTYNKAFRAPKSRFPLEPAPWKQPERNRGSNIKAQNPSTSVYGEMEKRVTELEFKRSSKDLRALKQILEAMGKTKERIETGKEDDASDLKPQTSNNSNYLNLHKTTPIPKKVHLKKFESSVQTIRTVEVVQKPRSLGSSTIPIENISGHHKLRIRDGVDQKAKDLTPRKNHFLEPSSLPVNSMDKSSNSRTFKSIQISKAPQHRSGGNPAGSATSSTTVSPRLQQKKRSQPTTPTPDSSRSRRHLNNTRRVSRHLSHQGDAISEQSDGNFSLASQSDIEEVTSTDRSKESNGSYQHKDRKTEIAARSIKDRSNGEPTTATLEQPSPVSVLDATFYGEESPSPVKKISNAFKEETQNLDEAGWSLVDLDHSLNSTRPNLSPHFNQEKLESIKYLVNKLRQVNSQHDEASTDHIASLCETKNPQHRYIAEILLASGILLKDLGSSPTIIQLHQSSLLVNPSLFHVLEQTKGRIDQSKFSERMQKKLIFDAVNEILFRKFTSAGFDDPRISVNQLVVKNLSGRKLLKELCSEMDRLQANAECSSVDEDDGLINILREDMMHQAQNWADYHKEVPGVVLDIERLIFKDLIGEIVRGEDARLQRWPTKH
ncbi:hypothetical protein RHMOL_Rhmol08G0085300 [Rhododendron molle]|uniref:Uncharacterized protein n=1 Tax=Rhododendron molle TaxID=49168 RepID=A0ACC0ML07_RHOML|nr:hypothetical protein RHMOL_Rhmol08G0085300 [Rhododendron molle]